MIIGELNELTRFQEKIEENTKTLHDIIISKFLDIIAL